MRSIALLLLSAFALSACYRAETITGSVVDETTGKPLAGAAVVANWRATGPGFDQRDAGHVATFETKSDDQGKFHIDSWGPSWHWFGKVDKVKAAVFIFKSGYQGQTVAKESAGNAGYLAIVGIAPDPGVVKLKPVSGSQRERIENFDMFNVALRPLLYESATCPWSRVPGLLKEMHHETLELLPHSRESGAWPLMTADLDLIANADRLAHEAGASCPSPKEIFQLQSGP
jgi:hypothetical protein